MSNDLRTNPLGIRMSKRTISKLSTGLFTAAPAAAVLALVAVGNVSAGDEGQPPRQPSPASIFTRWGWPGLSSTILASDACTKQCTANCGNSFQVCIRADDFNACGEQNNACDLLCLRRCRSYGGPVLNITY